MSSTFCSLWEMVKAVDHWKFLRLMFTLSMDSSMPLLLVVPLLAR